jgi:deferrochelatase/peroxidase EfeB
MRPDEHNNQMTDARWPYQVVRRIEIALGVWDQTAVTIQERTIGRKKVQVTCWPTPRCGRTSCRPPWGPTTARRSCGTGHSYLDGIDRAFGAPATGLLFICYQRDPRRQFIPIQRQLAALDSLNQFISHIGSAIFACPPGGAPGAYVGEGLLG